MKLTRKLRLLLSLTSLLVCICFGGVTVGADVYDFSTEEVTTSADDLITYADGKVTLTQLKSTVDTYAQQIMSLCVLSEDELEYLDQMYASQTDFYGKFISVVGEDGCGTYVGYEDVIINETNDPDVLKVNATILFSEKEVTMTLNIKVFDNIGIVVTSTEFAEGRVVDNANETADSTMDKLMNATANTLLGMGTVFVVLILISLIISCFGFIPKIQATFTKKKKGNDETAQDVPVQNTVMDVSNQMDDTELVAVIAAAIAASENTTTDGFVVRSIRRR